MKSQGVVIFLTLLLLVIILTIMKMKGMLTTFTNYDITKPFYSFDGIRQNQNYNTIYFGPVPPPPIPEFPAIPKEVSPQVDLDKCWIDSENGAQFSINNYGMNGCVLEVEQADLTCNGSKEVLPWNADFNIVKCIQYEGKTYGTNKENELCRVLNPNVCPMKITAGKCF